MDKTATDAAISFLTVVGYAGLGLLAGILTSVVISVVVRFMTRRNPALIPTSRRLKMPQRAFFAVLGMGSGVAAATSAQVAATEPSWRPAFMHVFLILLIIAGAYLLSGALFALEDTVLEKFKGAEETGYARRVRTQMQVIRRVGVAIVWICAVGGILLTFDAFRAIGASLFASAGVLSLVVGLAAQSTLGNVFAGIQIAFTDALRVGDVVVVNKEFGNVEEITLTYVVIRLWDDRRMIMPSTLFTTQPFENWTRREANLLGTVEMDVDWLTPVPALRVELQRIVEGSDLWDGRTAGLQVTDAVGGNVRVRAVVSARNSGQLFDLRCLIREALVTWIQTMAPYALPRTRLEPETTPAPSQQERREFIEEVQRVRDEELAADVEPQLEETLVGTPVEESDTERILRETEARRARREAERADRRAAKKNPAILAGHEAVRPQPSSDATQVLSEREIRALESDDEGAGATTTHPGATHPGATRPGAAHPAGAVELERESILHRAAETTPRGAESRLFSGSPEAEERALRLAGPTNAEMAQREDTARRRVTGAAAQPAVVAPPDNAPADAIADPGGDD